MLGIFEQRLGTEGTVEWPADRESQGLLGIEVLDAVQTIVDVLVDGDVTYRASFADQTTAYTDLQDRKIVISSKPLTEGGRPLDEIIAIMTGFAVHEIGHARLDERLDIGAEWPGKQVPLRLGNILQDVRLEASITERFPGLAGVFDPTFDWVAAQTMKDLHGITYGDRIAERLNFVTAAVRYAKYVTFASTSQAELDWWQAWGRVDGSTTDAQLIERIREGLAHIHAGADTSPKPGPEGTPTEGQPGEGQPEDAEEPEPTEGGNKGTGGGDGQDGDGDGDDTEGGDEGSGDSESDTEGEGKGTDKPDGDSKGSSTEGDGESEPELTPEGKGKGNTLDRSETESPMGDGAGGSGQAVTDADAGLESDKLAPTMDEVAEGNPMDRYRGMSIQESVERERGSETIKAGAFGTLKVRVEL